MCERFGVIGHSAASFPSLMFHRAIACALSHPTRSIMRDGPGSSAHQCRTLHDTGALYFIPVHVLPLGSIAVVPAPQKGQGSRLVVIINPLPSAPHQQSPGHGRCSARQRQCAARFRVFRTAYDLLPEIRASWPARPLLSRLLLQRHPGPNFPPLPTPPKIRPTTQSYAFSCSFSRSNTQSRQRASCGEKRRICPRSRLPWWLPAL